MRTVLKSCVLLAMMVAFVSIVASASAADSTDREIRTAYQKRFQTLQPNDLDGHLKLALWCRDQEAWQLLQRQCNYILRLAPDHEQAKLLAKLARANLSGEESPDSESASEDSSKSTGEEIVLTDEQVQILRRMELNMNAPERVQVKFNNDVLERFWAQMEATGAVTRDNRANFFKLPPANKAWEILRRVGTDGIEESLANDIEIVNDPGAFRDFNRNVMPFVLTGCATAKCHGGKDAKGFRLHTDRVLSTNQKYTNYMILHEYERNTAKMINRDYPDKSLLLVYGLPTEGRVNTEHPVKIDAMFRGPTDVKYRRIMSWIRSLKIPAPDYGFSLTPKANKEKDGKGDQPAKQ